MPRKNTSHIEIIKQLQEDKEIAILSQNDEQYVATLCRIITAVFDSDPKNPLKSAIVALIHEGQRQCQAVAQEGEELIGLLHDETDAALQQIRQEKQRRVTDDKPHTEHLQNQSAFPIKS